ncbi:MAG TPA: TIGR00730 family Rossman fold protein [Polyangiaceae bacterium]|jgi:hypothetical protein
MRRVCVFSGSRPGERPRYIEAARELGAAIASAGMDLVYGGASVGLMREAADAAMAVGGRVIGVIPQALVEREIAHHGVTELRVVDTMHTRKAMMGELSDGFVALPGGLGTLEELFEVLTWAQIGLHAKPVGLLDVDAFWAPLRALVEHTVAEGFTPADSPACAMVTSGNAANLLGAMQARFAASVTSGPRPSR